jgi:hypothetical protein
MHLPREPPLLSLRPPEPLSWYSPDTTVRQAAMVHGQCQTFPLCYLISPDLSLTNLPEQAKGTLRCQSCSAGAAYPSSDVPCVLCAKNNTGSGQPAGLYSPRTFLAQTEDKLKLIRSIDTPFPPPHPPAKKNAETEARSKGRHSSGRSEKQAGPDALFCPKAKEVKQRETVREFSVTCRAAKSLP